MTMPILFADTWEAAPGRPRRPCARGCLVKGVWTLSTLKSALWRGQRPSPVDRFDLSGFWRCLRTVEAVPPDDALTPRPDVRLRCTPTARAERSRERPKSHETLSGEAHRRCCFMWGSGSRSPRGQDFLRLGAAEPGLAAAIVGVAKPRHLSAAVAVLQVELNDDEIRGRQAAIHIRLTIGYA